MANHSLIYLDEPMTLRKRFKTHVVEVGVGALGFTVGGMVAVGSMVDPNTYASSALAALPVIAVLLLGIVHMVSGAAILSGLLVPRRDVSTEIHLEQGGWTLAAAGWLGFGWCMWYFAEGSSVGIAFGLLLGTSSALRAWWLSEVEEQARDRLRKRGISA